MEKIVPQKYVLYTRHELKSPAEIGMHAAKDIPVLEKLAKENGLKAAGPIENAYWNMSVKGVPHILEIWLPVNENGNLSLAAYKSIEPYKCLTFDYTDSLEHIGEAWGEFGRLASEKKIKSTAHDREVYVNLDFENPKENRIELQMGIE
jgi:hypothetical protein